MKNLRLIIERQKEKQRIEDEAILRADFQVVERGGSLWFTHDGVAFKKVPAMVQAAEVARELNNVRECAVEYERL